MASFFQPSSNSSSDIARRKKLAARLIESGKDDGQTQMVSGYAVKKSPLEGLAKALQTGIGGYIENQTAQDEQNKSDNARQTMSDALGAYTRSQAGDTTTTPSGESITWDKMSPSKAGQMYANMLMQNEDTAPMGMQAMQQNMANTQQMEMLQQKQSQDNSNWERDANLKRELAAMRVNGSGGGMTIDPDTGDMIPTYSNKPLPVGALKMQQEAVDALKSAENTSNLSSKLAQQATSGELNLGPVSNLINRGRNFIGASTPESVNLGLMETDLEKLRNDTLRLNKGVQTEGDAVRAMNEVLQSKNDPQLFAAAMGRLNDINNRAAQMQQMQIDQIRQNYNAAPMNLQSQNPYAGQGNPAINQDYANIQPLLETDMNAQMPQGGAVQPTQMGGGQSMSFNTPQEAEAANLPIGTVIMIGGRRAVVE